MSSPAPRQAPPASARPQRLAHLALLLRALCLCALAGDVIWPLVSSGLAVPLELTAETTLIAAHNAAEGLIAPITEVTVRTRLAYESGAALLLRAVQLLVGAAILYALAELWRLAGGARTGALFSAPSARRLRLAGVVVLAAELARSLLIPSLVVADQGALPPLPGAMSVQFSLPSALGLFAALLLFAFAAVVRREAGVDGKTPKERPTRRLELYSTIVRLVSIGALLLSGLFVSCLVLSTRIEGGDANIRLNAALRPDAPELRDLHATFRSAGYELLSATTQLPVPLEEPVTRLVAAIALVALLGLLYLVLSRALRTLTRFAEGAVFIAANVRDLRTLAAALAVGEIGFAAPMLNSRLVAGLRSDLADHVTRWQPPAWEVLIAAAVALVVADVIRARVPAAQGDH